MKPVMNVMMLGMLLSCAACLSQDPGDSPASDRVDEESTSVTEAALGQLEPDFYLTCSDDPNICSPGYGAVSITLDASCVPFGSSHVVRCQYGSVSL